MILVVNLFNKFSSLDYSLVILSKRISSLGKLITFYNYHLYSFMFFPDLIMRHAQYSGWKRLREQRILSTIPVNRICKGIFDISSNASITIIKKNTYTPYFQGNAMKYRYIIYRNDCTYKVDNSRIRLISPLCCFYILKM